MIVVHTATEDELSEIVATKLVRDIVPGGNVGVKLRKGGSGYLRSRIRNLCNMARREYVFILTDLDRRPCAAGMIGEWLGQLETPQKLVFRIAVREIEAWLLADREGMATLLGVSEAILPYDPDTLLDPKEALLTAARRGSRNIRSELIAGRDALASQGLGYNRTLSRYVDTVWNPSRAAAYSPSLKRAIKRLAEIT